MERNSLSLKNSKSSAVSDVLLQLENLNTDSNSVATDNISSHLLAVNNDLLMVDEELNRVAVRITAKDIDALTPFLDNLGFETLGSSPDHHLIEGYIAFDSLSHLEALADEGLIMGVIPVYKPMTNVGDTDSQADFVHEADRVREALPTSFDGTGETVAVFSNSYDVSGNGSAAADIASGDLPTGIDVLQEGTSGSSDEGRAMLQLIHDLAPGADLVFSSVLFGEADFAQQIRDAANPAIGNASVLVDDIIYFAEPFFQDGLVAQAIDDVVTNDGVTYFGSAGNRNNRAYESTNINFAPDSEGVFSDSFFDFDPGVGVDTRQTITLNNNQSFRPSFQWDDPFFTVSGVDTDLNIFLLDSTNTVVASSVETNITTQNPVEIINFTNTTGSQQNYEFVIVNDSGPNPTRIKYVNFGSEPVFVEYDTNSPTVNPHTAATNAQAVAAIPFFDQDTPEPFTSEGPSTFLFEPDGTRLATPEIRQTPNIAAIDATNTTFFPLDADGLPDDIPEDLDSFPNFFGTSAAAPHAAAVAALVQQANPNFTPQQVYNRLQSTAEDIAPAGFDEVTGFGLINAYDAIFGSPVPETLPFTENFNDGDLPLAFETNTNGAGRIQVTSDFSPLGAAQLILDSSGVNIISLNEAILHLDTTDFTDITLSFEQKEFEDEDNAMPATFSGSNNSDGVALSVDGTNWFRLVSLTGGNSTSSFQNNSFDLTAIANANGLTLGSDVQIKFQQFDDFPLTGTSGGTDGFAFDNIFVTGTFTGACNPTTGDDDLTSCATPGDDNINGLAGNDTLVGGDGNDTLDGETGDDILLGNNNRDRLIGGDGNDTLNGGANADVLLGNDNQDRLIGGDGNDTLRGGANPDVLLGNDNQDSLLGGDGNDTLRGEAGSDILFGQNNQDSLVGGDGNDTLDGGSGADILFGQIGDDSLIGGAGKDTLSGGLGRDRLFGGTESDRFRLESGTTANQDIIEDFEDGIDRFELSGGLSFGALTISQAGGSNTKIVETATNERIATVLDTDPADITMDDFV